MKKTVRPALLWILAGAILSLCTLGVVLYAMNSTPVLLVDTAAVTATAEQALACVASGDYAALEQLLYGAPQLGTPPETSGTPEGMLWQAYCESIQIQVESACTPRGDALEVKAQIRCLDIKAVTDSLQAVVPDLLQQTAQQKEDPAAIYDSQQQYREEFLNEVLCAATAQVLSGQQSLLERELTLQLLRTESGWKVVPSEQLQQFLSGFVSE